MWGQGLRKDFSFPYAKLKDRSVLPSFALQEYSCPQEKKDLNSLCAIKGCVKWRCVCVDEGWWGAIRATHWAVQRVDGQGPSCHICLELVCSPCPPSTIWPACLYPHISISHCALHFNWSSLGALSIYYHFILLLLGLTAKLLPFI